MLKCIAMNRNFNIEIFDNINILKELAKTWNVFLHFRICCVSLKNSEYLLSILSSIVNKNYSYKNVEALSNNMINEYNSKHTDFYLINKYINKDYNNKVLSEIVSSIEGKEVYITEDYNKDIEYLDNLDLDPILKLLVFQRISYDYLKNYKNCINIFKIIFNLYSKRINLLDNPILYPDAFFQINMVDHFNHESVIIYLKFLRDICLYGMETINFVYDNLNILKSKLDKDKKFKSILKTKSFFIIFMTPYIKIVDLMELFKWKRDKAARLLLRLKNEGLFFELKIKKEKLYINKYLIDLFAKGKHNKPDDFLSKKTATKKIKES